MSDLFNGEKKPAADKAKKQYHIIKLEAENVKRLTAVEITPSGKVITVRGKNAAGKSSVLDSIAYALGGADLLPDQPIRKGEKKARIKLDMGEIIVTRTFTEGGGGGLKVQNAEGLNYPSPQAKLDGLLSSLTFDPLEFMDLKAADQFAFLRTLVPLDVDLDELAKADKKDAEDRTALNRDAKNLRAQASGIDVPAEVPARVDVNTLMLKMSDASRTNGAIDDEARRRERVAEQIATNEGSLEAAKTRHTINLQQFQRERDGEVAMIDEQIKQLEQRKVKATLDCETKIATETQLFTDNSAALTKANEALAKEKASWPELAARVDVDALVAEIETAQTSNAICDKADQRAGIVKQAEAKEAESTVLSEAIDARKKQRGDAIAAAKMPIDGLSIGDGVVLFDELPLDQASTAQQLRISFALAIASNPELRIIRIKDGDKLDDDNLQLVAEMAEEHNFQVWLEAVRGEGGQVIVIEDGHVAGVEPETPTEEQPE